jgi:hypothetical protein
MTACALLMASGYSSSGTESATMHAPFNRSIPKCAAQVNDYRFQIQKYAITCILFSMENNICIFINVIRSFILADNVQLSGHTDSHAGWRRARETVALNLAIDWSGGCNFSGAPITLRIRRTNFGLTRKAEGEDETNEDASTYRIRGVLYFPYDFGRTRQSR